MKKLIVLVLVLAISAPAFAWEEEFDDYANAAVIGPTTTGGLWSDTTGMYNWVGDDYDSVSAAVNSGGGREDSFRSSGSGMTEFGGRIRLAPDSGGDMSGAYIGVGENTAPDSAAGYNNRVFFFAQSNQSGQLEHFKFASEMYDGDWHEDRHDFGEFWYPGTTFPLTLGEWYDLKAVEISPGTWEGSYKLTSAGTWTLIGTVSTWGSFDTNYGIVGVQHFARVGEIYVTPEPATIALLGLGGLALIRRKR